MAHIHGANTTIPLLPFRTRVQFVVHSSLPYPTFAPLIPVTTASPTDPTENVAAVESVLCDLLSLLIAKSSGIEVCANDAMRVVEGKIKKTTLNKNTRYTRGGVRREFTTRVFEKEIRKAF